LRGLLGGLQKSGWLCQARRLMKSVEEEQT
jgi:hypothetical protein